MEVIPSWIAWVWRQVREVFHSTLPIRFSIISVALIGIAFHYSDQGEDALRVAAETDALFVQVMFFIAVCVLAAMSWYWSRQLLRITYDHVVPPSRWIRDWAPRVLGGLTFALLAIDISQAARQYGNGAAPASMAVYIFVFAVLALAFPYVAFRRRDWLKLRKDPPTFVSLRSLIRAEPWPFAMIVLLSVVFFVAAWIRPQRIGLLGAPTIVTLSAASWVVLGGILVHAGTRLRLPILSALAALAWLCSISNDNHVVRKTGSIPPVVRPTVEQRFREWSAQLPKTPTPQPVFIVVTEGGGIRAAYWTAAVLTSLNDQVPGFSDHLFAISSVSGGSVGAATYATLLAGGRKELHKQAARALSNDALGPALSAGLQPDLAQRFIPWPIFPDRATALEEAWESGFAERIEPDEKRRESGANGSPAAGPTLHDNFLATFVPLNASHFPSLFFNATVVEKGWRAIVSNTRVLSYRRRNAGASEFSAAYDVLSELQGDIKISTAAHLGARFPYVSPAATIRAPRFSSKPVVSDNESTCIDCGKECKSCNHDCCHLVDGGYFENSGAVTAAEIITTLRDRKLLGTDFVPVVLIISTKERLPPYAPQERVEEILTPPTGLYNVRAGRGDLAVAQLRRMMNDTHVIDFVLTEGVTTLPLGWALSKQSRNVIDASVGMRNGPNWPAVHRVAELLHVADPAADDVTSRQAYEALPDDIAECDIPLPNVQCKRQRGGLW